MPAAKGSGKGRTGLRVVSRKGTSALYIRGSIRGRSVYQSAGTDDPNLAEEARFALEAELYRRAIHGEKPKVAFAAAAELYLKRAEGVSKHTQMVVDRLILHYGPDITCDRIDQTMIDAAGREMCSAGARAATILRAVVTPTKAVLNFAAERGWCARPAFAKMRGGGKRTDWFTPAEAEALIGAAADHLKPLLIFLFCTGARVGEAVALEWADVDLQHGRVNLRETKNEDDRLVDLPARAVAALANLPGRLGRVFLAPVGNPKVAKKWEPYRLSGDNKFGSGGGQIKRSWASAMKAAGIGRHLTPHHARHTWATWHYLIHKDLVALEEEGGWRTPTMARRYTKLAPVGMRDAAIAFLTGALPKSARSVQRARQNKKSA